MFEANNNVLNYCVKGGKLYSCLKVNQIYQSLEFKRIKVTENCAIEEIIKNFSPKHALNKINLFLLRFGIDMLVALMSLENVQITIHTEYEI